ncbi:MAG: hypothetical protein V9E96_14015 [Chitinophagaceae bacterium]
MLRYSYTTTYNWIGASRLALSLGNTIENSQENTVNGEFDFTRLYSKSRILRSLENAPAPKTKGNTGSTKTPTVSSIQIKPKAEVLKGLTGEKRTIALKKWRQQKRDVRLAARLQKQNLPVEMNGVLRTTGKLLTMVKRASINYSENFRSRLPGYMDSTRFFGNNFKSMQPGLDYVFGKQPDTSWLNQKAAQGLISRDTLFNSMFRQNFEQRLSITAQIEPIKEFIIDINFDKTFSKEYTELFKDSTTGGGGKMEHLSPYAAGGFSVSYIAFNTFI